MDARKHTAVCIVIPTYNEKENVFFLLSELENHAPNETCIVFVDDNSPDKTADHIDTIKNKFPRLKIEIMRRKEKAGIGSAYVQGFAYALQKKPDYILQMDADLSHNPEDIQKLIAETPKEGLAIGSRKIKNGKILGWGLVRTGMSAGAMWVSRSLLNLKTHDVTSGFRCFSSYALKKINTESIKSNGYAFQEEIIFRAEKSGIPIKEIPVTFVDRTHGKSKLSKKDIIEFFMIIVKLKFSKTKDF